MLNKYFRLPFAVAGDKAAIPEPTQGDGSVSWNQGYGPDYELAYSNPNSKDVPRDQNNQMMFDITTALQEYQQNGVPDFITTAQNNGAPFPYPLHAWVRYTDNKVYRSLAAANVGVPGASATWEEVNNSIGQSISASGVRARQTAAAATLTITADEVVMASALGGSSARVTAFNKTVNLATVGANGMDTGAAPVSGWVALYAIWNPTTNTSALLGVNATATVAPPVYGGANMPAGYVQSALLSVVPTNGASLIPVMSQYERDVYYFSNLINTSANVGFTSLSLAAAVPRNAWRWKGNTAFAAPTVSQAHSVAVCPTANGQGTPGYTSFSGYQVSGGGIPIGASIPDCPIYTAQTTFYALTAAATMSLNSYGYTI